MHTKPKLCSGILSYSQLWPITSNLLNAPSTSLLLSFASFFLYLPRSCGCCCKTSVICYSLWRGLLSGSLRCCDKIQSRENNIKGCAGRGISRPKNFNLLLCKKTNNKNNKQKDLSLSLYFFFLRRHLSTMRVNLFLSFSYCTLTHTQTPVTGSTCFLADCYCELPKAGLNSLQSQLQSPISPARERSSRIKKKKDCLKPFSFCTHHNSTHTATCKANQRMRNRNPPTLANKHTYACLLFVSFHNLPYLLSL